MKVWLVTCDVPYGLKRGLNEHEYYIVGEFKLEPLEAGYYYDNIRRTVSRKSMGKKEHWALLLFNYENEK